jgi:hypothetical protein
MEDVKDGRCKKDDGTDLRKSALSLGAILLNFS